LAAVLTTIETTVPFALTTDVCLLLPGIAVLNWSVVLLDGVKHKEKTMKAWSVIGLLFAAAIFATIPISPQVTPRGVELSVDQAQAITYGRYRRVHRRVYRRSYRYARRAYRGAYYYGAPSYYAAPAYYGRRYYGRRY
jgi:hypothetical protein